ncbi:hypothetical protein HPB50_013931 [Hyalomma asiaticum]|uniref:Uncharacterized protein n=1 Tax=Hyalomma asiaticum TaxID=266040 RepID=A0ACB7SJF3_HYAAI|nr:hypothetical protein HPB50_013931 [Hyalomma asiaticum]
MQNTNRASNIDVRFPVEVLASVWQQVKGEVIKNRFRKAGFRQNDGSSDKESSVPDDETSDPSVWPQVREAFGADSFSDFVTFDNGVVDNEELTDEEVRATIEGRSELSSDNDSEHEDEFPAVRLTSQQVIDRIDEVKDYFQLQQDDCSVEVFQLSEMRHKCVATAALARACVKCAFFKLLADSELPKKRRRLSMFRSLVVPRTLHNAVLLHTTLQIMEQPERDRRHFVPSDYKEVCTLRRLKKGAVSSVFQEYQKKRCSPQEVLEQASENELAASILLEQLKNFQKVKLT